MEHHKKAVTDYLTFTEEILLQHLTIFIRHIPARIVLLVVWCKNDLFSDHYCKRQTLGSVNKANSITFHHFHETSIGLFPFICYVTRVGRLSYQYSLATKNRNSQNLHNVILQIHEIVLI